MDRLDYLFALMAIAIIFNLYVFKKIKSNN